MNILNFTKEIEKSFVETKVSLFEKFIKRISPNELLAKSRELGISDVQKEGMHFANDTLKERIEKDLPEASKWEIDKVKGDISEKTMDEYFKRTGWEKIEGEVGCNGIDGLYVKRDKDENITDVLVVESKYNTSRLGNTKNGEQMSKEWIEAKISELRKKDYENSDYAQIEEKVSNGEYRARIWRMKEIDGNLQIEISKVDSSGNEVSQMSLKGNENYKINKIPSIDLNNPKSTFEEKIADGYEKIVDQEIQKRKG
ncbi:MULTISPECIES: hypothetical protein [Campylobacter]|uniref:hypothetical protein n=1 Tax=Campylobacter TaxID=194 RepID=UPI0023EFEF81|nr:MULTISPECIES: hypothetical protein [Campylobacter]MCI6641346.1 hypothetical protein [Campylobacter sp.]MDD7423292.1 hypothetical protein [Campylobacter hominis]MDY3117720.1 hypothetical protein [Campylobacter hominis]